MLFAFQLTTATRKRKTLLLSLLCDAWRGKGDKIEAIWLVQNRTDAQKDRSHFSRETNPVCCLSCGRGMARFLSNSLDRNLAFLVFAKKRGVGHKKSCFRSDGERRNSDESENPTTRWCSPAWDMRHETWAHSRGRWVALMDASCSLSLSVVAPFLETEPRATNPEVERLFKNNRDWVDRVNAEDPTFFSEQAKGQHPDFLYIGCSDSRVSME